MGSASCTPNDVEVPIWNSRRGKAGVVGRSPVPRSPGHLLWGRTQTQGRGRTEMAKLGLAVETLNSYVFWPISPTSRNLL